MESASVIRAARKASGLTQAELAKRSKFDQAAISKLEHRRDPTFSNLSALLSSSGHRLLLVPTTGVDAVSASGEIRHHLKQGDRDRALRALIQLNDSLVAESGLVRGALGLAEPAPTGERVWDAALAGLVAWRLGQDLLTLPEWVSSSKRFLKKPQTLNIDSADPIPQIDDVPVEFSKRGVLVWRDTFESV